MSNSDKRYRYRPDFSKHAKHREQIEKLASMGSKDLSKILKSLPVVKKGYKKYIILPDVHRPFHNKVLWQKIISLITEFREQIHGVIITGDYLDLFTLGSYNAESLGHLQGITLEYEYEDGNAGLDELDAALGPNKEKVYIFGNHEDRYFREINKKDNAKYGAALQSPTVALKLRERGYKVYENWSEDSHELAKGLEVCHGIFCNIHTSKKHVDEFDSSVIFGHTHRFSSFGAGKKIGYNIGWLGDGENSAFKYMYKKARTNKWMNGFAFVNVDIEKHFWVEPIQCYDNKFFYNNKIW